MAHKNVQDMNQMSDRAVFIALMERAGQDPRIVNEYEETRTVTYRNGVEQSVINNVKSCRVDFGFAMDLYTKYAEFDVNGKLVTISQGPANY